MPARGVVFACALVASVVACACSGRDTRTTGTGSGSAPPADGSAARARDVGPLVAPHGHPIVLLAVTDALDAALTADDDGGVRLWPTLDGTREPVVVAASAPAELAIVRTSDGLVGALRDRAGGVELLRFDERGNVRSRARLAAEPEFVQLVVLGDAILARRADHAIVELGSKAAPLVPPPGEQVLALASRGGRALAAIGAVGKPGQSTSLRWLERGPALRWGATVKLPESIAGSTLVLAPGAARIAAIAATTRTGVVFDLAPAAKKLHERKREAIDGERPLGFLDDANVVFSDGGIERWTPQDGSDPWARPSSQMRVFTGSVTAGGALVGGVAGSIAIATPEATKFVGYSALAANELLPEGELALAFETRLVWLDDDLRARRIAEVSITRETSALAIDDRHVLRTVRVHPDPSTDVKTKLLLWNTATNSEHDLGLFPEVTQLVFDRSTGIVAMSGGGTRIHRARLDLANATATPLPPLEALANSLPVLLDPAASGGVSVLAILREAARVHVAAFVDPGDSDKPLRSKWERGSLMALLVGVDRRGTTYLVDSSTQPASLVTLHDDERAILFDVREAPFTGAVDRDGQHIALIGNTEVAMFDRRGTERWRTALWRPSAARFTDDARRLVISTQGGLVALDVATGERVATGCGYGFGVTAIEPQAETFHAPVVCAEASE